MVAIVLTIAGIATRTGTSSPSSPPAKEAQETLIEMPARQLFAAYDANEIAANEQYMGRRLIVNGTIGDIGTDILNQPYITLDPTEYSVFSVQAMFREDTGSQLAALRKGEYVRAACTVDGKLGNVILRQCALAR